MRNNPATSRFIPLTFFSFQNLNEIHRKRATRCTRLTRFDLPYKKPATPGVTRLRTKPGRNFTSKKWVSTFLQANYVQVSTLAQILLLSLTNLPGLHVLFIIALILIYINISLARYSLLAKFMFLVASSFPMLFMIEFAKTIGDVLYFSITSLIVNIVSFLSLLTDYVIRLKKRHVITLRQHRSAIGLLLLVAIVAIIEISTILRINADGSVAIIGNVAGALLPTDFPPVWGILITCGCIVVLVIAYFKAKTGGVTEAVSKTERRRKKDEQQQGQPGYQVT